MKLKKCNGEGYHDPTMYAALTNITKAGTAEKHLYRPLVYICSPFSGDVEANTERARQYSRFAVQCGYIPIAPHLLFPQFMDDTVPEERNLAMNMNMVLLGKCEQVWVFGKSISAGMSAELKRSEKWHKEIRYFTECLEE